jgi:hypothetical protein
VPQVFKPRANAIARLVFLGVASGSIVLAGGTVLALHSDATTAVGFPVKQPVPFSHEHHVGGLGIDCRYCHTAVEVSSEAGMPATEVCMTCHSQLWTNAAMLAPVRRSLAERRPLRWNRVNDLADFVYFNHAAHIRSGVACFTCHGPVDRMPLMRRASSMQMSWCLDCHRDPAPSLRPRDAVFDPDWTPPPGLAALQDDLVAAHGIDPARLTDCYVCHR